MWVATDVRVTLRGASRRLAGQSGLLAAGIVLLAAGCGDVDHGDRMPLTGTVTIQDRAPEIRGTIYFDPVGGTGTGSSAEFTPDGKFEVSEETGPTPGQKYNVTLTTMPGIPAEGTPLDQIKVSKTYRTVVDIPAQGDGDVDLKINFDAPDKG